MNIIWPEVFYFVGKSRPEGKAVSSAEIAGRAALVAKLLVKSGCRPGDRIAIWLTEGENQLAAIFGCWMAGVTFSVLPSFAGRSSTERSQIRVDDVFSVLEPKLLLKTSGAELPQNLQGEVEIVDLPAPDEAVAPVDPKDITFRVESDDVAFIQFTSGSTGGAKGAVVRFGQLESNLASIAQRMGLCESDRMISWAPLYHDMGLMAVLLPLSCAADLVLMETDHFVRRPTSWLEAISNYRGTVTTAPPTALKLLSRRKAQSIDLSSWRYAWIGGEMVFPTILEEFEKTYAPAGLAKGVLQPTYGMAETVVGISCGMPGESWSVEGGFVSCGQPLPQMEMQIVDESEARVAPGRPGHIKVRGPSVMKGYLGLEQFGENAWFDTGDLGFEISGRLHITGRVKDVLKRGGESFPASVVEIIAEQVLLLRTGRAAAFANQRPDVGKEEIVLLVESHDWSDDLARKVGAEIVRELGLQVDVIRNTRGGRLPRTSSGKIMRQKAAELYRKEML